jgi:multiple sugar transport system substrate-binding protein
MTMNGISIWYVAKDQFPAIGPDTANATPPIGPVKRATVFNSFTSAMIFKYSKYPNAAKAYLKFMLDEAMAQEWVTGMRGYIAPALRGYLDFPVWTSDPNITPYRDAILGQRFDGYNGKPGRAAGQAVNEFVISDMFADVCINSMAPKDAVAKAEKRLTDIYKAG